MKKNINIEEFFKEIVIDYSWSFRDLSVTDTSYISHGYYTYPAKFIPQLAEKLILKYSSENDTVLDPFAGSFTTVVEALKLNRKGIGNDINEISFLLGKVKTTPIEPEFLNNEIQKFYEKLESKEEKNESDIIIKKERIDFWFKESQKIKMNKLLENIISHESITVRNFFLVCFSQILKTCSIWMQKSVKPVRDMNKKEYDPLSVFGKQIKKMVKLNKNFYNLIGSEKLDRIENHVFIYNDDSKSLPITEESVDLIITSPPYVTSYEYADLHQLPLLWLGHMQDLQNHRKKFIGSSQRVSKDENKIMSEIADKIILSLGTGKKASEVKRYFQDMLEVFIEMKRVLKKGGKFCIVIGNTEYKKVPILNAEVYLEQLQNLGFSIVEVIKREIPSKMLPSTRDSGGKFTKKDNPEMNLVYPTEYIIVVEK